MIDRQACVGALAAALSNQLVVTGLGYAAFDTYAAGDRARNFYLSGALGSAASVAFGLAVTRRDEQVVCIDGDGSLLSNLGSLATIGRYQVANLLCVVLDNKMFQITGGQPTHTAFGVDLAAIGRGCGIASACTVETLEAFRQVFTRLLGEPGPHLLVASVDGHQSSGYQPRRGILIKYRFMQAIGLAPDVGALAWT